MQKNVLSQVKQLAGIRTHYPAWDAHLKRNSLEARGILQPSPISEKYLVRIDYKNGNTPNVRVVSPALICRDDAKKIPHMYAQKRLCLHYPKYGEWTKNKLISETIIPWASLWLYYYEVWYITGVWLGGGIHPNGKSNA